MSQIFYGTNLVIQIIYKYRHMYKIIIWLYNIWRDREEGWRRERERGGERYLRIQISKLFVFLHSRSCCSCCLSYTPVLTPSSMGSCPRISGRACAVLATPCSTVARRTPTGWGRHRRVWKWTPGPPTMAPHTPRSIWDGWARTHVLPDASVSPQGGMRTHTGSATTSAAAAFFVGAVAAVAVMAVGALLTQEVPMMARAT